ncbi:MAG: hypothetical protein HZA10_03290 [Nitrospirae bacterium]|nr:hypothetical protein [Nitrospirota bacterium]
MHISYRDTTNQDLKYATNSSGSWITSTIDSTYTTGWDTSIAIDSNNKVHISYKSETNGDLRYATNVSGSWVTSTIDANGWDGAFSSIGIDSNDKVHIAYYDQSSNKLEYATNVSGLWTIIAIDYVGDGWAGTCSLAIDSNDKVHISYYNLDSADLKYATNVSGLWSTYTIDSTGNVGATNSIAIDLNNKVHIVHQDSTNMIKYITNASGSWVTNIIDSGGLGWNRNLALDLYDNVHISYKDTITKDLKYATNAPLCTDSDNDGYYAEGGACGPVDCDDNNSSVFPSANDSQCDGIDNNCDGQIDEGYVPTPTTCGIGACQASGNLICQNGSIVDTCTPSTPGTEGPYGNPTCSDTIDNDCDGTTDSADSNCQAVDLIETSVSNPPATATIGSSFQVSDTVKNQGNITSGASTTRYYLSIDKRKDTTDKRLTGSRAVPALNPGATSRGRVNVTIPITTPAGTYYLLACADDTNTVAESNERNNCKASSTTVQVTP